MRAYAPVLFAAMFLMPGPITASGAHESLWQRAARHGDTWMVPGANSHHPWLYVSSYYYNTVSVFDLAEPGTPQIGTIARGLNGPSGMAIDSRGTLYVANGVNGTVTIYPHGASSPSMTLSASLIEPTAVAVDAAGNVFVATRNLKKTSSSVVVFAPGQTSPSRVITSGLLKNVIAETLDAAGNLYVSDYHKGVSEIAQGSSQVVSLGLVGWIHTNGIAIDPTDGNLFVADGQGEMKVRVYAPGDQSPQRPRRGKYVAWALAAGTIGKQEYIFVPDAAHSAVYLFPSNSRKMSETVPCSGALDIAGVAFKPAGVP